MTDYPEFEGLKVSNMLDRSCHSPAQSIIKDANVALRDFNFTFKQKKLSAQPREERVINPEIIEEWINETLGEAQHMKIPGFIANPERKEPMQVYGIDKASLMKGGIDAHFVPRVYKGLYVYSMGFNQMLKNYFGKSSSSNQALIKIWKVYAILLEFCCETEYRMLV